MTNVMSLATGEPVADIDNLTDAEARQTRYAEGVSLMRITDRELNVPGRPVKDGRIFMTEGRVRDRWFENQDSNIVELTTEAALRFEDAVEDAEDEDTPLAEFSFEVTLDDLTMRRAAFVHGRYASPRELRFADSAYWVKPIIGLDVDADGEAIEMKSLRKSLRKHLRNAESGFTAATGGAFED